MKIAIVAPCPVPYVVGGAEKLWWGLAAHFNEHTSHQAEIIKLPSPEADLASLLRSYERFAALDLGGFDLIISGKYPAWMVGHGRHVCYMLHRLRGLYDCYQGAAEFARPLAAHPGVASLRQFISRYRGSRAALTEFFGRWNELMAAGENPRGMLDFPGPLAREVVHWLDEIALSPDAISSYAAISRTVALREGYFPAGVEVAVAHPPPHRDMTGGEAFEHFYTVSRLDRIKRVGMVVEAMRMVRGDVPLIVGGTGPEEENVRALALGDPRIRFVGFQNDAEVRNNYRNALAVPFAPWQEDYGLIAVEAMQCAKPVITARDSGGPCELVEDGVSGFIREDVRGLAEAMQRFVDDPALARSMGRAGRERASGITWSAVAKTLLDPAARRAQAKGRRKLVVASTFAIHPPRHGGQVRSFQIYRALAPEFETVIVSACPAGAPAIDAEIAPGVREIRVPLSREHQRLESEMEKRMGTPVTDVMMTRLHALTPKLGETLRREASDACAVVASHPYLFPVLKELERPVWYEAQDFELHLKKKLFGPLPGGAELIDTVSKVDRACAAAAQIILCASADDAEQFVASFGVAPSKILDVPNGTDALRITFCGTRERAALKVKLGLGETSLAFFMGSGHWPNIEAVRHIFELAVRLPWVAFVVMGSVCYAFDPKLKPENVLLLGEVDDITRNLCLQACDVALNPVEHGSGTNIKMLDYFAAGIPVVTTESGGRGLPLEGERFCLMREIEQFPEAIEQVLGAGTEAAAARAAAARSLVEERFDWHAIVQRVKPRLVQLADEELARRTREGAALGATAA